MGRLNTFLPWIGGFATVATGTAAWPYTVDDAFVTFRYAERIAAGAGYTMRGGPPTDGVTGPLALVPALIGEVLLGDPVWLSKLVGLVCGALAVALVVRRAAQTSRLRGAAALALMSVSPFIGVWSVAGLETGIATLLMTIAVLGTDVKQTRGIAVGLAVAALAWLRPELAPACLVILVVLIRRDRRAGVIALSIALGGVLSVVAFRLAMFGSPLPLSVQAKPPDLANGAAYVARGALIALGGGGVIALGLAARYERVLVVVIAVHALAMLLAGGDWMPGFRLFVPILPAFALAASAPIAESKRMIGALLFVACAAIPAIMLASELPRVREAGAAREREGAELAAWLREHGARVALVDAGFLVYASGVEPIDLGGITDPEVARVAGGHLAKEIDPAWLRERDPDLIVLHSTREPIVDGERRLRHFAGAPIEHRVANMDWVRAEFRVERVVRYAPDYFYVVLSRQ